MKRHRIYCVGGVRLLGPEIDHLLGITMIGSNQRDTACRANCFRDPSQASVHVLASFDCFVELAGVPDHVGVSKVDDEYVGLTLINKTQDVICDFEGGHFRFEIVSGDLRRRHQQALLAAKLFFRAAIEEIGDVGVLLGLREPKILDAKTREDVGENVLVLARRKRDRQRKRHVVN